MSTRAQKRIAPTALRLVVTGISSSLASRIGIAQREDGRSTLSRECRDALEFWVSVSPEVRATLSRVARLAEGTGKQVGAESIVVMLGIDKAIGPIA